MLFWMYFLQDRFRHSQKFGHPQKTSKRNTSCLSHKQWQIPPDLYLAVGIKGFSSFQTEKEKLGSEAWGNDWGMSASSKASELIYQIAEGRISTFYFIIEIKGMSISCDSYLWKDKKMFSQNFCINLLFLCVVYRPHCFIIFMYLHKLGIYLCIGFGHITIFKTLSGFQCSCERNNTVKCTYNNINS